MEPCYLGVDGGNTKTIAFIADSDGRILGAGRSGCSDPYAYPTGAEAVDQIALAVDAALAQANRQRESIRAACYSLAGADWPEDYAELHTLLSERGYGQSLTIYNDAIGALRAGSPDGTGVVIACGTGGAMAARNAVGAFWHTSFWQDSMCGRELGFQAMRAVRHAEIGMEQPTSLRPVVLRHFGQETVEGMLRRFWLRPLHPPTEIEVSRLAPHVLDEAERGDPVARQLVIRHGEKLADYGLAAARMVGIEREPFYLVMNGGLFRHPGRTLSDAVIARVRLTSPDVRPIRASFEPVVGALMLALEAAGFTLTDAVLEALRATMPAPALFHT